MADSVTITVTALAPSQQCYLGVDIYPKSGRMPFDVTWYGSLTTNSNGSPVVNPALNNETVKLQIWNWETSLWIDTGQTALTGTLGGYDGAFTGSFHFPADWAARDYQFRMHYDGNAGKGLIGCEKVDGLVATDGEAPNYVPIIAGLAGVVALGTLAYFAFKK